MWSSGNTSSHGGKRLSRTTSSARICDSFKCVFLLRCLFSSNNLTYPTFQVSHVSRFALFILPEQRKLTNRPNLHKTYDAVWKIVHLAKSTFKIGCTLRSSCDNMWAHKRQRPPMMRLHYHHGTDPPRERSTYLSHTGTQHASRDKS